MCVAAFIAFISFTQINSYWADQNHFNGIKGWLGIGLLFTAITLFGLYKTGKTSTGQGG